MTHCRDMKEKEALGYLPESVFGLKSGANNDIPRVFVSPSRYIQGDGVVQNLGIYLRLIPVRRAGLLISEGGLRRFGKIIISSLQECGIEIVQTVFNGECSLEEIKTAVFEFKYENEPVDCVVAVGGGKCLDAGKSIAYRLGIPSVICPSLASSNAPCSALSALYSQKGIWEGAEFFPYNPSMVVVDTRIIADAPVRYLVAGMGDALAAYYEAETCFRNVNARSVIGGRLTLAAMGIGKLCATTLFEFGEAACKAVQDSSIDESLERVTEANILLSGLGFESGGMAAAHSMARAFTGVEKIQQMYLHGEMVAMGVLTQLTLEGNPEEAKKVSDFFASVGLPVSLNQLSLSSSDTLQLEAIASAAIAAPIMENEPFEVSNRALIEAMILADKIGMDTISSRGQIPYEDLHCLH